MRKLNLLPTRTCDGCVKCCEGWLEADVRGHKMSPGKPCVYLNPNSLGCSEYSERPKDPCIDYRCVWLDDETFPEDLKPSISGLLVTKRNTYLPGEHGMQRVEYYEVKIASQSVDVVTWESVLSWLKQREFHVVLVDTFRDQD